MPNLGINPNLITQKVYANLNIQNVSGNSKLKTVSEGFIAEADAVYAAVSEMHDNMYINTADEPSLEAMGYQEGLYRVKEPMIRFFAGDELAYITIPAEGLVDKTTTGILLAKGDVITVNSQSISIKFLEDVVVSSIIPGDKIFVSVDISSTTGFAFDLSKNSQTAVSNIPKTLERVVTTLLFGVVYDIAIPAIVEDINTFRARLSYAKNASKYGTDAAIRVAIGSNPLITDFKINYDVYPYQVTVYNPSLLLSTSYRDYISSYAVPAVDTQILLRKSAGSSFVVDMPRKVEFYINLVDKNNENIVFSQIDLRTYIASIYVFGEELVITKAALNSFFAVYGISSDVLATATLQVYKYKQGFSYLSADASITISEGEYPMIVTSVPLGGQ